MSNIRQSKSSAQLNPKPQVNNWLPWLILPVLLLVTAIYFQILDFQFLLNFDDDMLILDSEEYQSWKWENLKVIFGSYKEGLYHPITSLSWMADYAIWGQDPFGFHLSNLILHLLNCLLVFFFVRSLVDKVEVALMAALFFGIHPMHVENVAWLSSRKDLMLAFFFLLSLWCYQLFTKEKKKNFYLLSWCFATLAMMSKVSAIVLPFLFALMDWFQDPEKWKTKLLNKLPFLLPAGILIYVNFKAQQEYGYIREVAEGFSGLDQFFFVSYSAFYYLFKLLVPLDLAPKNLYPEAGSDLPMVYYLSILFLLGVIIAAIKWRKSRPLILFGLAFYFLTIGPNLKIIPTGNDVVSNRYAYLAYLGLYLLIAWWLSNKLAKLGRYAILLLIILFWSSTTYQYANTYQDSRSVWTAVIDAHQDHDFGLAMALNERGQVAFKQAKFELAAADYDRALSNYPNLRRGLYNRAQLKSQNKAYQEALVDLDRLIGLEDSNVLALTLRSTVLGKLGRTEKALKDLQKAATLQKGDPKLYNNMGIIQSMQGDRKAARSSFKKALTLAPEMQPARINLGRSFLEDQQYDSAISELSRVYKSDESIFLNAYLLAQTYFKNHQPEKAKKVLNPFAERQQQAAQIASKLYLDSLFRESLAYFTIAMGDSKIRDRSLYQRAQAYKSLQEYRNAIDDLLAVIESVPNGAFFYELGMLYLKIDNRSEACRFLEEAAKRKVKQAIQKQAEVCN